MLSVRNFFESNNIGFLKEKQWETCIMQILMMNQQERLY